MKNHASPADWWHAARPRTLWAAVAPVMMGCAIAQAEGGFLGWAAAAVLACALLIQVGTNLANDYFDASRGADTAARIGPRRASQTGRIPREQVRRGFILCFSLAVLLGVALLIRGGWPILWIGLSSVALGMLYTAGPAPLAYVGLGDLFAFLYFGPVAVLGTVWVQTLGWSQTAFWGGMAAGCFSLAILTVNNFRDLREDALTGKRTLAVRFGEGFARIEFRLALLVAGLIPLLMIQVLGASLLFAAPTLLCLGTLAWWWRAVDPTPSTDPRFGDQMNRLLAMTGRMELLYALLFSLAALA